LVAATPPRLAPTYNKRRGELWALFQTRRTIPTPDDFDVELRDLRDLLRDAFYLARMRCADAEMRALANAARGLDAVEMAAGNAGLVPSACLATHDGLPALSAARGGRRTAKLQPGFRAQLRALCEFGAS